MRGNHQHRPNQRPCGHCCGANTRKIPDDPQKLSITCTKMDYVKQKLTKEVTHLFMRNCKIPDQIFEYICNFSITRLKSIDFSETQFDTLKIKKMCQYDLTNLQQLSLSQNIIEIQGIKWLTKIDCRSLTSLYLSNCCIGSQIFKILCKSKWPQLETLWMKNFNGNYQNTINNALLEKINDIDWKKLKRLQIEIVMRLTLSVHQVYFCQTGPQCKIQTQGEIIYLYYFVSKYNH